MSVYTSNHGYIVKKSYLEIIMNLIDWVFAIIGAVGVYFIFKHEYLLCDMALIISNIYLMLTYNKKNLPFLLIVFRLFTAVVGGVVILFFRGQ